MNPFEFILAIVIVVGALRVIRFRMGDHSANERPLGQFRQSRDERAGGSPPLSDENRQLRDEVRQLKERIQVLERITVDKENSLAREIDGLRDR